MYTCTYIYIWYGMIWYDMIWYDSAPRQSKTTRLSRPPKTLDSEHAAGTQEGTRVGARPGMVTATMTTTAVAAARDVALTSPAFTRARETAVAFSSERSGTTVGVAPNSRSSSLEVWEWILFLFEGRISPGRRKALKLINPAILTAWSLTTWNGRAASPWNWNWSSIGKQLLQTSTGHSPGILKKCQEIILRSTKDKRAGNYVCVCVCCVLLCLNVETDMRDHIYKLWRSVVNSTLRGASAMMFPSLSFGCLCSISASRQAIRNRTCGPSCLSYRCLWTRQLLQIRRPFGVLAISNKQIRCWRAVNVAGLHGKGFHRRRGFVHSHRLLLLWVLLLLLLLSSSLFVSSS